MAIHVVIHEVGDGETFHSTSNAFGAFISENKKTKIKVTGEHALPRPVGSRCLMQFTPAVKVCRATVKLISEDLEYSNIYATCLTRVVSMSKGALSKLYPAEYNSLRGAISRAKVRCLPFDKRLKDLRNWLAHIGPRPCPGYSIDRRDYYKGYEVDNLRWASKLTQTLNRRVTKFHTLPGVGRLSTRQLADRLGLPYSTVYKRLRHGWTVEKMLAQLPAGVRKWQWPAGFEEYRLLYNVRPKTQFLTSPLDWVITYIRKLLLSSSCSDEQQEALARGIDELEEVRSHLLTEENEFRASQIEKLAAPFMPLKASGFGSPSAIGVHAVPADSELSLAL